MNQTFITSKTPASGLEPEHQKNLITQRLAISCLTKLGLYRHIVGGEGNCRIENSPVDCF